MKKDDEIEDAFDMDSISLGKFASYESIDQNGQFPLRIGTNFFEDDSDSFTSQSQNKSFDEILNQKIAHQKTSKQEAQLKYSAEQIIRLNKINQNIKSIIVLENQLKIKIKSKLTRLTNQKNSSGLLNVRKNFGQIAKKIFKNFESSFSERRTQYIKFDRIAMLPPSKRIYYLNLKDQKEMGKRKYLKTLIAQKDIQLLKKRGQLKNQQSLNEFKVTVKKYSLYITQCASTIEETKMSEPVNRVIKTDLQQLGQQLKKYSVKHQQTMKNLNHEIGRKVAELLQAQEIINRKKLKRQMELENKIISSSENLLEIVPPKRLFSLMPNLNRESFFKV